MQTKFLKVVKSGDMFSVRSEKSENGQLNKRNLVLRELGGQYEDEYLCALFGHLATCQFAEGDLVVAALRFQTHEVNGQFYQDIVANDIVKLNQ